MWIDGAMAHKHAETLSPRATCTWKPSARAAAAVLKITSLSAASRSVSIKDWTSSRYFHGISWLGLGVESVCTKATRIMRHDSPTSIVTTWGKWARTEFMQSPSKSCVTKWHFPKLGNLSCRSKILLRYM